MFILSGKKYIMWYITNVLLFYLHKVFLSNNLTNLLITGHSNKYKMEEDILLASE
jgi:hypothetical protein